MEINKRYFLNQEGSRIAAGQPSSQSLTEFAIPEEAVWACTACGACVDICPVGNEPMRDIMDIRRALVLMDNNFPEQLQTAFRGMERTTNPWNIAPADRMNWAKAYVYRRSSKILSRKSCGGWAALLRPIHALRLPLRLSPGY
jgi:Fe-S oxidoreductase